MINQLSKVATTHEGIRLRRLNLEDWAEISQLSGMGLEADDWEAMFQYAVGPRGMARTIQMIALDEVDTSTISEPKAIKAWVNAIGDCIHRPKPEGPEEDNPGQSTGLESASQSNSNSA